MKSKFVLLFVLLLMSFMSYSQTIVKMKKEGGVFSVPCIVNGLQMKFIFDTGASNVCISLSEAKFMLKNGYLKKENIIGYSKGILANGEIIENTEIIISDLEIGNIKLKNIRASVVHEMDTPLLLGQSAIQKLGKIQIEGENLVLMDQSTNVNSNNDHAFTLIEKANNQLDQNLNELANETYVKAYNLCPECFDNYSYYNMGLSYNRIEDYNRAALIFEELLSNKKQFSRIFLGQLYYNLGRAQLNDKQYSAATISFQKALSDTLDYSFRANAYFGLGNIHFDKEEYYKANEDYKNAYMEYQSFIGPINKSDLDNAIKYNYIYKDETFLGLVFFDIAHVYEKLDDLDRALYYYRVAEAFGNVSAKEFVPYLKRYLETRY